MPSLIVAKNISRIPESLTMKWVYDDGGRAAIGTSSA
jgi:hypothetical protein